MTKRTWCAFGVMVAARDRVVHRLARLHDQWRPLERDARALRRQHRESGSADQRNRAGPPGWRRYMGACSPTPRSPSPTRARAARRRTPTTASTWCCFAMPSERSAIATTYSWFSGSTMIDADIVFWDGAFQFFAGRSGCSGGFYIEDIAAHEFGHALGLGHSTMCDGHDVSVDVVLQHWPIVRSMPTTSRACWRSTARARERQPYRQASVWCGKGQSRTASSRHRKTKKARRDRSRRA